MPQLLSSENPIFIGCQAAVSLAPGRLGNVAIPALAAEYDRRMPTPVARDLIGYAGDPPHARWPGEARIAVNFVMNYEEGSEYNVGDDGFSEATLTESGGVTDV